jgi:hypothetical protein
MNWNFVSLAMLICFGVTGCESQLGAGIASPDQLYNAANAKFSGGPIEAVLQRYGMPESQFMSGGIRVLVWHANNSMRFHEPTKTTTTGTIGDSSQSPWYSSIPYRETTTSSSGYNVDYTCTMNVGVKPDGMVDRVGFGGQMGACQAFMP